MLAVKIKPFTKPILIMKNTIHINFAIFLIIANIICSASASTDISTVASPLFEGTEGCFYFTMHPQTLKLLNSIKQKCATQMAPDSTFKIALSLMAFDAEIIDQKTIFKWDKTPKEWRSGTAIIHQRRGCNFLLFGFRKK
ncbi:penicillin-binding transpeptidase domain-containing protein [Escherichia coli]|uniref:penicillin-binding transpeptidase domain-containing protein n=1 Tax=Escherichia coli TaxID=562 RepID=UPI00388FD3A1